MGIGRCGPPQFIPLPCRDDPALEPVLVPLLDDKKEAVRVRAAAGFLRLEGIKSALSQSSPLLPARRQ